MDKKNRHYQKFIYKNGKLNFNVDNEQPYKVCKKE